MSPLARLLDWLSHLYNVVVVVSGGNHGATKPVLNTATLDNPDAVAADAVRSLFDAARHRRLLSPAEAVNVITVGALHADGLDIELPDTVIDPVPAGSPASYSPVGFGFRRSVKPEVLLPGGRQVFSAPPPGQGTGEVEVQPVESPQKGPGLGAAAPGMAGELDAITYSCGTSNAAALASRSLSEIMDVLEAARSEDGEAPIADAQYYPVLAKTLLVHAAGWHDSLAKMRDLLGLSGQDVRRELTRILGYGRSAASASARRSALASYCSVLDRSAKISATRSASLSHRRLQLLRSGAASPSRWRGSRRSTSIRRSTEWRG
ncbi:MAG: S8 family serine peptidase [Acidimicrobiia bacterium]|nr:S8 family serine peptidase [Acidimicrobiia bacterium]